MTSTHVRGGAALTHPLFSRHHSLTRVLPRWALLLVSSKQVQSCDSGFRRQMGSMSSNVFTFGEFELDMGRYQLRRGGFPLKLENLPLELLMLLVKRRGELVTRSE